MIFFSHTVLIVLPANIVLSAPLKCCVQTELFPMAGVQFLGIYFVSFVQGLCSFQSLISICILYTLQHIREPLVTNAM